MLEREFGKGSGLVSKCVWRADVQHKGVMPLLGDETFLGTTM
jgi:hypothetical protein